MKVGGDEINQEYRERKHHGDELNDEIEALKSNNTRIWFNFNTNTPGVIFIKLHDCMKPHIDVHALSDHLMSEPQHL